VALALGVALEAVDHLDEALGIDQAVEDRGEHGDVVAQPDHAVGELPHLDEATVEVGDAT